MIKKFKLFEYISHYQSLAGEFHLSAALGIDEEESEKIYNAVADFYKDPDQRDSLSYLGSGSFGSAFTLDDKVLKITTDKNEVDNIEFLRKKDFAGIVSYYDIRKINLYINDELYDNKDLYAIIMDKVEPLSDVELECYRILYRIGFISRDKEQLRFEYTISYHDIDESSAKNFKSYNDGSRAKEIFNIIKESTDYANYRKLMTDDFGDYVSFEFAQLEDLQDDEEFEEVFFRFYYDIRDLLCDVIKYKLSLYDSHEKNVGKDEEGHFKMIDLGFRTNRSRKSLKLKPIEIHIEKEIEESFCLMQSEDGVVFKPLGYYDSEQEAVDEIEGDVEEKYIKLKNETILILFNNKYYYRIISNKENNDLYSKNKWTLEDPDQLSLNLWQDTKSKKS